jgi:magnesium-transporting ATPase (P-type)
LGFIEGFAVEGLRTLLLTEKEIKEEDYEVWNNMYVEINKEVFEREEKLEEIYEIIEQNLELIGSTAIEDKL